MFLGVSSKMKERKGVYVDKKGYMRDRYGELIHRNVAYNEIYLKNRLKYPLNFKEYIVHHDDKDKKNNSVGNLKIMTQKDHDKLHGITTHKPKLPEPSLTNISYDSYDSGSSGMWWLAGLLIILAIVAFIYVPDMLDNGISVTSNIVKYVDFNDKPDLSTANPVITTPKVTQKLPDPIIVAGSKTDIIITNNLERSVSLDVTYRIYSNWFGMDSQEKDIFEVGAKEEKSFKVYDNPGCNTAPCLVSIISFREV